jgi:hypothetical protein
MSITDERLEWHILTLEATPEKARSIWQNEQLAFYRELLSLRRSQWRPIETAKKNSDFVPVMVTDGKYVTLAEWHADEDQWWEINNSPTDSWGSPLYPTHWMPLPSPPMKDSV